MSEENPSHSNCTALLCDGSAGKSPLNISCRVARKAGSRFFSAGTIHLHWHQVVIKDFIFIPALIFTTNPSFPIQTSSLSAAGHTNEQNQREDWNICKLFRKPFLPSLCYLCDLVTDLAGYSYCRLVPALTKRLSKNY